MTVQYDKVLYLLADTPQSRRLAGDHVEIYHYPDGRIEPRVDGTALPFTTYDKLCEIDQGAIVENKRLGHVLQVAQARPSAARQSALAIGTGKSAAVNARQDAVEEGAARTDAGRYRRRPG